jgi:SNF family Na+-dependent transporter
MPVLRETVKRPRPRTLRERTTLSRDRVSNLAGLLLAFIGVLWALGAGFKMMEVHREVSSEFRQFVIAAVPAVFLGFLLVLRRALQRGTDG